MLAFEEVQKHNSKADCWVIIHGKAYDVTDFVDEHPGGSAVILKYAGKDATKAFDPIHPPDTLTKYLKKKHHLGEVKIPPKKPKAPLPAAKPSPKASQEPPQDDQVNQKTQPTKQGATVDEYDVEYDEQDDLEPIPTPAAKSSPQEQAGGTGSGSETSAVANDTEELPLADQFGEEYDDDEDDPPTKEELNRRRKIRDMPDISQVYNLNDFEFIARHTMGKNAWAYYSSASDDEITLRENHLAYHRVFFRPRVMVDVTNIDLSTTMLGSKSSLPFYITATALGKLGHPDGEKVLTRSAHKQGIIQMIPTLASCSFDEIVDEAVPEQDQWFQLYVNSDREVCKELVQHAEKRGMKGLFITVDAPQLGNREKDMRSKNVQNLSHVQGDDAEADRTQGAARAISSFIDTGLSWKDLAWFRSITKMPIVLKGVQTVEDAIKAHEHGVDGIVISNHGGRQLDFAPPPLEILIDVMPILQQKGSKMEVYVDGGVRRATDVIKALCLGAKGVGIGRPFLYAMSTYGDEGVYKAIQLLKDEMIMTMRLLGATSIDQLGPSFVDTRRRMVTDDKLFDKVYEPLELPKFKSNL